MAVFAYVRVATTEQVAGDEQFQEICRYAVRKGLEIPHGNAYSDVVADTALVLDRPGFMALWHRIAPGDVLLLRSLDRLSGSVRLIEHWVRELAGLGVTVKTLEDPED